MEKTKHIALLFITGLFAGFTADDGLYRLRIKMNNKRFILIPNGFCRTEKTVDGHGERLTINYLDSSGLYYFTGRFVSTPNEQNIAGNGWMHADIICRDCEFSGQSGDGRYWKEVRIKGNRLGYWNVTSGRKALFDSSLKRLSRERL